MTKAAIIKAIVAAALDEQAIAYAMGDADQLHDADADDFHAHMSLLYHAPADERPALLRVCCRAFDLAIPAEIEAEPAMMQLELCV